MEFKFVCVGFRSPSSERTFSSVDVNEIVKQFNTFLHGCVDFDGTVQVVNGSATPYIVPGIARPWDLVRIDDPTYVHNAPTTAVVQHPIGPIHLYENIP